MLVSASSVETVEVGVGLGERDDVRALESRNEQGEPVGGECQPFFRSGEVELKLTATAWVGLA